MQHRSKAHGIIVDSADKSVNLNEEITIPNYFDMSCDECTTILKSFKHAKSHYLEVHQTAKGYIKCCGMKLISMIEIDGHIKWHQNPDVFR